jgi:transposase-like protein
LRVPQDRAGRFSTELFERYQRSERALVAALAEMYVQGVSTRKVKAITEELCGHSFSASSISAMNQRLDATLAQFATRPLVEAFPYLILDARYERVREAGVIVSQAVLIAIGIDWDGRRQVLAVELAHRESRSSWRDFLLALKGRGLHGVEFVVADDHAGLRQRCARFWRRQRISAAMCISSGTRSTTCRAGSTTTACRSCAGYMTGAISPKRVAIWPPGSPSGRANIPSSPVGSKTTSMRR